MSNLPTFRFAGFILLFLTNLSILTAQSNNECAGALQIVDPGNFCSPPNAAQNLFATPSNVLPPPCFSGAPHDVWFCFVAEAPNVVVIINGSSTTAGGSLVSPQVALYEGSCDNLQLLGCETDPQLIGVAELRVDGLIPGNKYFFRVDGLIPGTFQFCVRNFFFDGSVSGDCPTAIPLCDKSPFNVQAVAGPGNNANEVFDAPCFSGFGESNSTWYAFTAANDGTLEFKLTPNNPEDDIDFVVYRLPNGIGDCSDKIVERCMAAGDLSADSPCMGPTGLNAASTAIEHASGCMVPDDNNFLRFMDVQAGNSYALMVNNFTTSGNGFQVEWGGTVQFVGPDAIIDTDRAGDVICVGDTIRFTDSSVFDLGIITDWGWTFGEGASTSFATVAGPNAIVYQTSGMKLITMTIKTSLGCEVSAVRQIMVENCCPITLNVESPPTCRQGDSTSATVQVSSATPPLTYMWSNGQQDSIATGLVPGNYTLTVTDGAGCQATTAFTVLPAVNFMAVFPEDTIILSGTSATLAVQVNNTATQVEWASSGSTVTGNPVTLQPADSTAYVVTATFNDCTLTDTVRILVYEHLFEVPNAFTPNADQMNDRFRPVLYAGTIVNLSIWSRWGQLVYEGDSPNGWDGTFDGEAAPSDVYVFQLQIRLPNGVEEKRHGDVTLLR